MQKLVIPTSAGLYCPPGDFYIDPCTPVARAVITHAHGDHARAGSEAYLATEQSKRLLQIRLGESAIIETLPYNQPVTINGVSLSFHPAGHILGSAQIRLAYQGEVWVVSGDYKVAPDPTCISLEPVQCHTFITESTFGLPIYRWPDNETIFAEIYQWWRANCEQGKASILLAYSLGKAQRLLAGLQNYIQPIYTHASVEELTAAYRHTGVALPATIQVNRVQNNKQDWSNALIIAPPACLKTHWLKQFGRHAVGFASGWMLVRGVRKRRAVDKGFVFSDHADWPGLLAAIKATGAEQVLVTHGAAETLARYLTEQGIFASALARE